jgi:hypothetical protein
MSRVSSQLMTLNKSGLSLAGRRLSMVIASAWAMPGRTTVGNQIGQHLRIAWVVVRLGPVVPDEQRRAIFLQIPATVVVRRRVRREEDLRTR